MEKALRDKKRAIGTCIIFFVIALIFTAIAVFCVKERMYVIMLLFAICSAICYYCAVFALFRFFDARAAVDMIDIMKCYGYSRGAMNIAELSDLMGWSIKSTRRFMEKCVKKEYIR